MKSYRVLSLLLVVVLLMSMVAPILPIQAQAASSGTCGDNLTWTLDDEGTLTISGTGAMEDYYNPSQVPWNSSKSAVKKVMIESGVTSISAHTFYNCTALTDVVIPEGVTSIGTSAFDGCTALTGITIPNSVASIGDYAFYKCTGMTSVTIPDSVVSIGTYAFIDCTGLEEIHFNAAAMNDLSESNFVFYNAGKNGGGITVYIGANVTQIPARLCYPDPWSGYPKITEIIFAEGSACESIGAYAFRKCTDLTSVTLDKSVTNIGGFAFTDCTGLTTVKYNGTRDQKETITIAAANDPLKNATWQYTVLATQEDLQQVLSNAESGTTVILTQDVALRSAVVWTDVTLLLNGYTLTVDYFTCYGSVMDAGDGGDGLVIVNKAIHLAGDNSFLPIYDTVAGGYRFYKYELQNLGFKAVEGNDNAIMIGIRLNLHNTAGYDVLATTSDEAMDMLTYLQWQGLPMPLAYSFRDDTLRSYASQTAADLAATGTSAKAILLTVSGINGLEAGTAFTTQPAVTTAPGVTAQTDMLAWTVQ